MLTCRCLERPASISSAVAMPNTFVDLTAKSFRLGYGSEDILYYLLLPLSSPVNMLHWFPICCDASEEGTSTDLCRKPEQLFEAASKVAFTEESMCNGKYCLNAQSP